MERGRRLNPLGRGIHPLERVEQGLAEASGPHWEAGHGLSSSEMPLGAQQLPPLWGLLGAESGRGKKLPTSPMPTTPQGIEGK